MSKSKPSKKLLKLAAIAAALVLIWVVLIPYRTLRANSLAKQAEQVYAQDPVKAIAIMEVASQIKPTSEITSKLGQWQLVPEINAKPQGNKAVSLAYRLVALRQYAKAEQVLENGGTLDSSGVTLLAELRLAASRELDDTKTRLEKAVLNDPADLKLHQLLQTTYQKLGNQKAASAEAAKIERLKAGKP